MNRPLSSRGAALITVLGFSVIIISILQSVLFDSKAEHISSQHKLNELRARYSARSGMEISLLRVLMYRQAQSLIGDKASAPVIRTYLDLLWSFPFAWPLPISNIESEAEKEEIQKLLDESFLKAKYSSTITPEDGKIDLNDLSSPIPHIQQFTFDITLQLLNYAVENTEGLEDKYQPNDLLKIVNNIADWTDIDNQSRNGGSEETLAENQLPINRSFISLEEIRKVPKVEEDIYKILKSHATVYGTKGLNLNYASPEILRALNLPNPIIEIILNRTQRESENYSPFANRKSFCEFMKTQALDICDSLETKYKTSEMLRFNTVLHFRIQSLGQSQNSLSKTEAIVFDAYRLSEYYKKALQTHLKLLKPEDSEPAWQREGRNPHSPKKSDSEKIHYNSSSPLFIMYWKENF